MRHQPTAIHLFAGIVWLCTVAGTGEGLAQESYTSQSTRETKYAIEMRKLQWQYPSYGSSSSSGASPSYAPMNVSNVPTLREIFGLKPKQTALERAKAAGNDAKVRKILEERALRGEAHASYQLGEMSESRWEQSGVLNAEAEKWYRMAAGKGHTGAMYALSLPYRVPIGVTRSKILEGKDWLEKAAAKYHAEARQDRHRYETDTVLRAAMNRILQYDEIGYFAPGLDITSAKRKGKVGFIDQWGREVVPVKFDHISPFVEGMAVVHAGGKYGYVTPRGAYIEPVFDEAGFFSEGRAVVKLGGKAGVINSEGDVIVPFQYDEIRRYKKGYAAVRLKDKWGFIGSTGKAITPLVYDAVEDFSDRLAAVNKGGLFNTERRKVEGGKWGAINSWGEEVVPVQFDEVRIYSGYNGDYKKEEKIEVRKGKKWSAFDKDSGSSKKRKPLGDMDSPMLE